MNTKELLNKTSWPFILKLDCLLTICLIIERVVKSHNMDVSTHDGFKVFFCMLDAIWKNNTTEYSDTLPWLLGSMALLQDEESADPAMLSDWLELFPNDRADVWLIQAKAKVFLEKYSDDEIGKLINKWDTPDYKKKWMTSVEKINSRDCNIYSNITYQGE